MPVIKQITLNSLVIGREGKPVVGALDGSFSGPGLHLILGRAGSGKTTLLMTLAGFLPPISGGVNEMTDKWEPAGKVCLAFQNPETLFFLPTVGEEVSYALVARGEAHENANGKGREWLVRWGLSPDVFWQRNPFSLSGGEKRRVALAACTVFQPPLVLLDEPLAGLDLAGQESLLSVLGSLAEECLVLLVTHDPEAFLPLSRSILLLDMVGSRWFPDSRAFLAASVAENRIYPLPDWYRRAMFGRAGEVGEVGEVERAGKSCSAELPWPEAQAVFNFIRR